MVQKWKRIECRTTFPLGTSLWRSGSPRLSLWLNTGNQYWKSLFTTVLYMLSNWTECLYCGYRRWVKLLSFTIFIYNCHVWHLLRVTLRFPAVWSGTAIVLSEVWVNIWVLYAVVYCMTKSWKVCIAWWFMRLWHIHVPAQRSCLFSNLPSPSAFVACSLKIPKELRMMTKQDTACCCYYPLYHVFLLSCWQHHASFNWFSVFKNIKTYTGSDQRWLWKGEICCSFSPPVHSQKALRQTGSCRVGAHPENGHQCRHYSPKFLVFIILEVLQAFQRAF